MILSVKASWKHLEERQVKAEKERKPLLWSKSSDEAPDLFPSFLFFLSSFSHKGSHLLWTDNALQLPHPSTRCEQMFNPKE